MACIIELSVFTEEVSGIRREATRPSEISFKSEDRWLEVRMAAGTISKLPDITLTDSPPQSNKEVGRLKDALSHTQF